VVDGDTVDVAIDGRTERVRLIGIDTPEVERDGRPGECFGAAASAFTAALLPPGTQVRIERDVVPRDHYGRLLGYVHRHDGLFVNEEIVRQGFATPMTFEPNSVHARRFVAAAAAAEREELGLWSQCNG
jgi:micrococcal nuclease